MSITLQNDSKLNETEQSKEKLLALNFSFPLKSVFVSRVSGIVGMSLMQVKFCFWFNTTSGNKKIPKKFNLGIGWHHSRQDRILRYKENKTKTNV